MKPIRVQRKRTKGWKMPDNTVNVTRPGKWGNPFTIEKYGLDASISLFKELVTNCTSIYDLPFRAQEDAFNSAIIEAYDNSNSDSMEDMIKGELRGKNLMCFCKLSDACHADILLEVANQ